MARAQRPLDARDFEGAAWWPLTAMARAVAEYEQTWRANLVAVKARGDDPHLCGSVKESFAHAAAARRMLVLAVNVAYTGPKARQGQAASELVQQHTQDGD